MTQHEILRMAMIGICARIERENEINEITKLEHGRESTISKHRLEKLNKDFAEVQRMILELEITECYISL